MFSESFHSSINNIKNVSILFWTPRIDLNVFMENSLHSAFVKYFFLEEISN